MHVWKTNGVAERWDSFVASDVVAVTPGVLYPIDMRLDGGSKSDSAENGTRYTLGDLMLKTTPYVAQSIGSARTIRLQFDRSRRLRLYDLLITFTGPSVQLFGFITRGGKYYGCRDFV